MTATRASWPCTGHDDPPVDYPYRSAAWLLGRHPRLATLAARVIYIDEHDHRLRIDLDHLSNIYAAESKYGDAWDEYEATRRPPEDEDAYYRWQEAGPRADDFAEGLRDVLVMSSGELAYLRLLAILGSTRVPFRIRDLPSLDAEGQRMLTDWCAIMRSH